MNFTASLKSCHMAEHLQGNWNPSVLMAQCREGRGSLNNNYALQQAGDITGYIMYGGN